MTRETWEKGPIRSSTFRKSGTSGSNAVRPFNIAWLSCGISPRQQILNPFNSDYRHDDAQAFLIMGKVIDKRLIWNEPPDHSNFYVDLPASIELSAEGVTGSGIRDHDQITRHLFGFKSDHAPPGRCEYRACGDVKPTHHWFVARQLP